MISPSWIEHDDPLGVMVADPAEDIADQITLQIDDEDAVPGGNIAEDQPTQQPALTRSGRAEDQGMPQPVRRFQASARPLRPG